MKRILLKSKIHQAIVTGANLNYEGSISIDSALLTEADILLYEKVDVYNISNGARFSTYVMEGSPGEICLNGAAARLVNTGDLVIIASYAEYEETECEEHHAKLIMVNEHNQIVKKRVVETDAVM